MKFLLKSSGIILFLFAGLLHFPKIASGQQQARNGEAVKIGLLVPDSNSVAAINAASLAIKAANSSGGYKGRPFELVVRYLSGPWGTGSKQAVDLIFDEKVWVLLGSHDGRNAHIVEQAATKSKVVFMSAWAGDPTLSQAFVPWFFNVVANDSQQADAIADVLFKEPPDKKIAIISDDSYDSGSSLKSLFRRIFTSEIEIPFQLLWKECGNDPRIVADKLMRNGINDLVIFCEPKTAEIIVRTLNIRNIKVRIFGSYSLMNEDKLSITELKTFDDKLAVPFGTFNSSKMRTFSDEYFKAFGKSPGFVAASAFDAINVLVEAIRKAGSSDREKIQNSLKEISYDGISGWIRFDEKGNRIGTFHLVNVKDGLPSGPSR